MTAGSRILILPGPYHSVFRRGKNISCGLIYKCSGHAIQLGGYREIGYNALRALLRKPTELANKKTTQGKGERRGHLGGIFKDPEETVLAEEDKAFQADGRAPAKAQRWKRTGHLGRGAGGRGGNEDEDGDCR